MANHKIIYAKPNSNQHMRLKLGDFKEQYINLESLKDLINSKMQLKEVYDFDQGWNTALRNLLINIENENI